MSRSAAALVFVAMSTGCHNCGSDGPVTAETDTFGPATTSGFFDDTTTGFITTVPVDDTADDGDPGTTSGTTGAVSGDECEVTADCAADLFCVAPFDQSLGPNGKGDNACVAECVVEMDEDRWCADASACCDPTMECTDRGYCVPPGSTGTDSGDTGAGSDTGSGSGDGSDSGGASSSSGG